MTQVTINLSQRYAAAFGTLAKTNQPNAVTATKENSKYNLEFYEKSKEDFEEMSFSYDGQKVLFGSVPFLSSSKNDNILAPPPIVSFSRDKKHIITDINGTADEVIERWSTRNYDLRIRGILVDMENHQYPSDKITALNKFFEYNGVVDVAGTQFFDKSISSIYLKGIEINGVQGFADTIQFVISARAIKPVGFTLSNPNT